MKLTEREKQWIESNIYEYSILILLKEKYVIHSQMRAASKEKIYSNA